VGRANAQNEKQEKQEFSMKALASAFLGTTALVILGLGVATPAQARSDFGVYVGPGGFGISVEQYRGYCRDPWYRHRYWNYCERFYGDDYGDDYGYGYNNFFYDNDDWRGRRHHHHDRDWGGEGRHHDFDGRRRFDHDGDHHHHDHDGDHHHHDGGERGHRHR